MRTAQPRQRGWRHNPDRDNRQRRPLPSQEDPAIIPDSKVGQYRALLRQAGILDEITTLLAGRPGPAGFPIEALFVGFMLACTYRRGSTNLDDVSEVLATQLTPHARELLGIPEHCYRIDDALASHAAYARVQRAFNAVTTVLDPHRHNRRSRVPGAAAIVIRGTWTTNRPAADRITRLANGFVHASIEKAVSVGALRKWNGDIGIDGTPAPTWGRQRRETGDVLDPHADWYAKGGSSDLIWADGLTLAFSGHADPAASGKYPRLALGMELHTPNIDDDRAVTNILSLIDARFRFRRGIIALDRGYGDRKPTFYHAIRATDRDLVFDYKSTSIGKQKSTPAKAAWFGGVPICPHTPAHLLEGAALLAKKTSRTDKRRGRELMDQVVPFQFQTKEHPKEPGGSYRIQCPAAGPSPTVTCPWAEERENRGRPDRKPMPAVTIELTDPRNLRTTPLTMPRVQPPEKPFDDRPICCKRATSTVPSDSNPKYRQTYLHGSTAWHRRYSVVRALNEGGNGSVKSIDLDVADAKVRLPRGRVAQTLLLGIQLMMANLRQIRVWGWGDGDKSEERSMATANEGTDSTPVSAGAAPEPIERPPR